MILFRYSVLILENLPNHPEAKEPDARRSLRPHQKRIPRVIDVLERLRPEIDKTYDQWLERQTTRRDADREPLRPPSSYAKHAANDSAFSWSYGPHRNIINARDYQDLAVDLAKREMRRRTPETGLLEDDNGVQRSLDHQREPSGKPSWRFSPHDMNDDELRRQMEETRRQLDRVGDHKRDDYRSDDSVQPATYYYPSINKASTLRYEVYEPSPSPARDESSRFQPPRPPKESFPERVKSIRPPPRPGKEPFRSSPPPRYRLDEELGPALPPKVAAEPAAKQSIDIIEPAARLENGDPLRAIFLPTGLRQKFLDIAEDNTRILGIETCGLLCGAIVSNAFVITHLVIPEQKGTPDTCETVNEAAITNFCIEKELVTIGWIHTHPTQTCFMSSRDLHTHCSNQALLPESIAIVCAPRHEPS
jgi:STAM-binding protein